MGKQWKQWEILFWGAPKSLQVVTAAIKIPLLLGRKVVTKVDSILKSRDITLPAKVHLFRAMIFSSSHVWLWELGHGESWALKNWCFWTVVLEKTLESPLDFKEIQPVYPKGNSPQYSLEGRMLKLKLQYFGHLMQRTDSFEKTLMLGKIEGRRRRWWQKMRWLVGITNSMDMSLSKLGVGDGQGGLACCSPWGHKELGKTEWLN